ncbi:MAG TPA: hypothetical protein PKC43_05490 [Phycisphaerales bacterium]|nr:hypothetical protein [Phycisphaerales bacterium]HMP36884.1 hypothetical protein [Phycisphaerales bacterium]
MKTPNVTLRASTGSAAPLRLASLLLAALPTSIGWAQSSVPAIFVANNGNLEGSVSSLTIAPDGSLAFRQKLVLGSVPSLQFFDPGLNAYSISISPDGRWLAVSHATASTTVERISVLEVLPDAGIALAFVFDTPDSPLDVEWVDDGLLAVTRTSTNTANNVLLYTIDPEEGQAALSDSAVSGGFNSWIAVHPSRELLFTQESSSNTVRSFVVEGSSLTQTSTAFNGSVYPLGLGVSPDGTRIYSGGGISAGGKMISGWTIDAALGVLTPIPGSPWISPGQSPKQVAVSGDGSYAYVGHGTDATIRGFAIAPDGALVDIGVMFDVGFQGSLGEIAISGDLLFATDRDTIFDGQRGVYSFTIGVDGSLNQNGPLVDTQGISPNSIAIWRPAPGDPADLDGNGTVDGADLGLLLAAWGTGGPGDLDGNGIVDGADLGLLLAAWQ